jgi:hypothetical protein
MLRVVSAIVLVAHGLGHVLGFLAAWTSVPMGFTGKPWIFGGAEIGSPVGKLFGLVWLVALAGFVAAGYALYKDEGWWRTAVVAASVISLVVILPWWNTVTPGSRLAAVLVDIIVIAVVIWQRAT